MIRPSDDTLIMVAGPGIFIVVVDNALAIITNQPKGHWGRQWASHEQCPMCIPSLAWDTFITRNGTFPAITEIIEAHRRSLEE